MKARQSLMDGMPVRPPERVHFSAAAADAKAMASCTAQARADRERIGAVEDVAGACRVDDGNGIGG